MTKLKYDVTDVEAGQDYETPVPIGLYVARITDIEQRESAAGNDMIAVIYEIASGEWKGRNLWDYVVLTDNAAWKLRQFLEAIGAVADGKKQKGTLELESLIGTLVQVRTKHQTDSEFGTRAKVGSVLPMPEDAVEPDDEEEFSSDNAEVVKAKASQNGASDDDWTWEDLEQSSRDDLEEIIDEEELDVGYNKRTSDEVLRERVAEALGVEEEDPEDDPDPDDAEDYSEMSLKDLKATAAERGLATSGSKTKLIARLEEDDGDGEDGEPF